MATAQSLIDRAMRLVGALESGESPTADETTDVLYALNTMLESWRLERLMVYAAVDTTKALVSGDASYTIGTGENIDVERPIKIENAYVTDSDTDIPITIITKRSWDAISDKTVESTYPQYLYYEESYPNGVIHLWPVPTSTNVLTLSLWTVLGAIASAATTVSLPPGYERALAYNLAVEIAPEFQVQVSDVVASIALNSKAAIKRANVKPISAIIEFAQARDGYNIFTDVQ